MRTRPLRILQVTRVYWPNIGGIERHVQWIAEHLVRRGHRCDVVTLDRSFADGSPYPPYDLHNGVNIYRVPFQGSTRYPLAPRVRRFVGRYDVVHVHAVDFMADYLAFTRSLHGRPLVLSTHGGFFHTAFARPLKELWFRTVTRQMLRRMDMVLYTSEQDAELFAPVTPRGRLLRQAVDTAPYAALDTEPTPGAWITVGRVDVHKGIADLLRTLAVLKDKDPRPFQLQVIGPAVVPGLVESLSALRDELGLTDRVHFRGKVSTEALWEAARTAELGLYPSEYESFGISVVETMAAGVIPILSDIRAFRYIVADGGGGFVTDFRKPAEAAAVIARARDADQPALRAAARRRAATYDMAAVVDELEGLYDSLCGSVSL